MEGNRADRRAAMRELSAARRRELRAKSNGYSQRFGEKKSPVVISTSHEPLKVFRIEHPDSGQGPFTHDSGRGRFASDAMVYLTEPQEMASNLRIGCPHHYAFVCPATMMAAIQSFVLLREFGFHFAVYESHEHIVLPDGQVAFIREKATKLETYVVHEFPFENYF